eukprot:CAMPEP_0197435308 /NCGR_PEP_ID=MMETSP1175-20131217/2924_1 /TAXON_ID=1003142 /ORGANISM="Triceratium dubium, Strain CCMP147" /LENGTH=163 /DNA_ID=CAMNT_0042964311 /DNA_START=169 /DNA_END=660 /DNA_ORIENTATION=-
MRKDCEPGRNSNCCLDGGDKTSLWPGQTLQPGEWLCRGMYAFGILPTSGHRGTLHVLEKQMDDSCEPIWTAMDDDGSGDAAEGTVLEMVSEGNNDGNAVKFGRGGGKKWTGGCGVDDSRLKMALVDPKRSNPKVVKIVRSKKNWRAQWWVDVGGDEENDCENF